MTVVMWAAPRPFAPTPAPGNTLEVSPKPPRPLPLRAVPLAAAAALAFSALGGPTARAATPEAATAPQLAIVATAAPGAPVPAALMAGLAVHAEAFEQMKRRGAFTLDGKLEQLDGDGKVSETKELRLRVTARPAPATPRSEILRYLENGADKTAGARERAASASPKRGKRRDLKLPFLPSEQPRYTFAITERHAVYPTRVRVAFTPREPAEDALKGSAWVDTATGRLASLGFSLSRNPTFIDHVEVQLSFGLDTPLGRAPSDISFEAHGRFLFFHKHLRGRATVSSPGVAF
ncbi:MAG: hypothetical protein IPF92_26935 [Myxococcales bacterium]|nr:hypothetical protein [Myxococcales bacterium]